MGDTTAAAFLGIGSFAEVMTVDEASAVAIRTDLLNEQLALLSCGVTTGVCSVLETARVRAGESVAVVGCGAGDRTGRDQLRPYVETVLEAFGGDRVLWGSDWPVVTAVTGYEGWFELARSLVPPQWHGAVFGGTAMRVYGLNGPGRAGAS